jgi:hypothetical protein
MTPRADRRSPTGRIHEAHVRRGALIILAGLFAYSIKTLGMVSIQEAFVRIGWGSRRNSPAVWRRTSRQNGGVYVDR